MVASTFSYHNLPTRPQSETDWHTHHIQAAQCRAVNLSWEETAKIIKVKANTAKKYILLPGWSKLYRHFLIEYDRADLYGEALHQAKDLLKNGTSKELKIRLIAAIFQHHDRIESILAGHTEGVSAQAKLQNNILIKIVGNSTGGEVADD